MNIEPCVPPELAGQFPKLPSYRGNWWPIYWTPIAGSGERITAFIVAVGDDGQWCVRPTINDEVFKSLPGNQGSGVRRLHRLVLSSMETILTSGGELSRWVPPITGFTRGEPRHAIAENVRQIAAQGIRCEAAFAEHALANLNQA